MFISVFSIQFCIYFSFTSIKNRLSGRWSRPTAGVQAATRGVTGLLFVKSPNNTPLKVEVTGSQKSPGPSFVCFWISLSLFLFVSLFLSLAFSVCFACSFFIFLSLASDLRRPPTVQRLATAAREGLSSINLDSSDSRSIKQDGGVRGAPLPNK
jgi:hypothetical protein